MKGSCVFGRKFARPINQEVNRYGAEKEILLETRNITLDMVLEKAIALETAKKQMQCMTAGGSVNAIRKREEKARDKSGKT